MNMATISTKVGTFEVSDNGNNGSVISIVGVKIAEFPSVSCWNKDSIENAIEQSEGLIKKRIRERIGKEKEITKENAVEVLEKLISVLGNENKGFYSSRLKQCINKLKSDK